MRVVCIKQPTKYGGIGLPPVISIGRVLTVFDTEERYGNLFYYFIETGREFAFRKDFFIEVLEDNIDEMELLENRQTELA